MPDKRSSLTVRLRVRELREARGLTQAALAQLAHIRPATLNAIEANSTASIRLTVLASLARALDVPAGELFSGPTRRPRR